MGRLDKGQKKFNLQENRVIFEKNATRRNDGTARVDDSECEADIKYSLILAIAFAVKQK
jgi:hypothetical protein